jgi:phage terminase large subunit-like protein
VFKASSTSRATCATADASCRCCRSCTNCRSRSPKTADGKTARRGRWVNPNLNRSVDEAFLSDELLKAEREGAEQLALIASQHFNVEVGLALRNDRWRGADYWPRGALKALSSLDEMLARCEVATIGGDGGGLDDLFGGCRHRPRKR